MYQQYLPDAIAMVSAWPDVEDDEFPELVKQQAIPMSGCSDHYYLGTEIDNPPTNYR